MARRRAASKHKQGLYMSRPKGGGSQLVSVNGQKGKLNGNVETWARGKAGDMDGRVSEGL